MPGNLPERPWKAMAFSGRRQLDQGLGLLLSVEHFEDAVGGQGLRPENIVRVARLFVEAAGSVAVDDRAAKGHVLGRMAVATQRDVPAGEDELELLAARRAEDRHALLAKTVFVVLQLPIQPCDPVGLNQADEDLADQPLLVGRVEIAVDHRLGDVPVGRDPRPQQAERLGLVVPGESRPASAVRR